MVSNEQEDSPIEGGKPVCTTSDDLRQDMVQMNTVELGMMNELMPVSAGYAEKDNYFQVLS